MSEKNLGIKLMDRISELVNLEVTDAELSIGIFLRTMENSITEKMNKIEKDIDSKIKVYFLDEEDVKESKDKILNAYKNEFNKISEKFEERFVNIQIELQEAQANQKIALANFKKVMDDKDRIFHSERYQEYLSKRNELKSILETSLNMKEYSKYNDLLKQLENPLKLYTKKSEACIAKFNDYNEIINESMIELEICQKEALEALESMMKYSSDKLAIVDKSNILKEIFSKIWYFFAGSSKFQTNVVDKMENELTMITSENVTLLKEVEEKTAQFVATIAIMRKQINDEFKLSIS